LEKIFDVGACGSYIGTRIVTFFGRPPFPGMSTVTTH
jgi:hypothetical protein